MNTKLRPLTAAVSLALFTTTALGQPRSLLSPPVGLTGSQSGPTEKPGARAPRASNIASAIGSGLPPFKRGPVAVHPHFLYSIQHGNGILRVPGEPENTTAQIFSPGTLFEIGKHWTLDYTLTRRTYSAPLLTPTTDHAGSLTLDTTVEKWTVRASQSYRSDSPTLVETGGQTHEKSISSWTSLGRTLGQRSRIDVTLHRHDRIANPIFETTAWTGTDWVQWSASTWLRHDFSPRFNFGIGYLAGYDEVKSNPDMFYTQPQAELGWDPTAKLSLRLHAALEYRKAQVRNARRSENVIYRASASYSPVATTSFSASVRQELSTAYFADQTTKSRGWDVSLQQRLFKRFFANLMFMHGTTSYLRNLTFDPTERNDSFDSSSLSVSTPFAMRGILSVYIQHAENTSQRHAFTFTTDEVGGSVTFNF